MRSTTAGLTFLPTMILISFASSAPNWLAVEVERSGAQWTPLRPSPVMAQRLSGSDYPRIGASWRSAIRNGEVIRAAYADVQYPLIDEDDLAAVTAAILTDDRYAGQVVRAYGPLVSTRERGDLIGETLGRAISFEEVAPGQAAEEARRARVPEELIELTHSVSEGLARLLDFATKLGALSPSEPDLRLDHSRNVRSRPIFVSRTEQGCAGAKDRACRSFG